MELLHYYYGAKGIVAKKDNHAFAVIYSHNSTYTCT